MPNGEGVSDRGEGHPLPVENYLVIHKQPDATVKDMASGDHGGDSP